MLPDATRTSLNVVLRVHPGPPSGLSGTERPAGGRAGPATSSSDVGSRWPTLWLSVPPPQRGPLGPLYWAPPGGKGQLSRAGHEGPTWILSGFHELGGRGEPAFKVPRSHLPLLVAAETFPGLREVSEQTVLGRGGGSPLTSYGRFALSCRFPSCLGETSK